MGRVAAIGEAVRVQGLRLAGVLVLPGEEPAEVRASWAGLPDDVAVVVLTSAAAAALNSAPPTNRLARPTVVMPP